MSHAAISPRVRLVLPRTLLLKAEHAKDHGKFMHSGKHALYGTPPRWHLITPEKPAPKGAPIAAHPQAAGQHAPAQHFTPEQWAALKLPDSNVNSKTFNGALDKLKAWADAGDVTAIVGAGYGSNSYAQKLVKVANHLLGLFGSAHKVEAGQKAGTHAAVQDGPAAPHPTGLPEHLAPKTTPGLQEPGALSPLAQHVKDTLDQKAAAGDVDFIKLVAANNPEHPQIVAYAQKKLAELQSKAPAAPAALDDLDSPKDMAANHEAAPALAMPDFQEGKTTTGVKAYYEKQAQKVIDHGLAGNVAVLEGMPDVNGKSWQGKTANSKKLLTLHAAALAHAKGGAAAAINTTASKSPHIIPSSDADAGFEVHVTETKSASGSKYSVAVKDVDSGQFLPTVKTFPTEAAALEHADALAAGKAPGASQAKTPAVDQLVKIGQAKAAKQAATIAAVENLGYGVQVSKAKGLLFAGNKGGMAKAYANQTQAVAAAQKLVDAGIDASVIGLHPYFVAIHGVMPGAKNGGASSDPSPMPVFDTYSDAQAWAKARAKEQGLSWQAYTATPEYKTHVYPALGQLYQSYKSGFDAESAATGQKLQSAMSDAGVKPGDTVSWTQVGQFLSQTKMTGVVKIGAHGIPYVHLNHEVAVSKPGGKIGYTKKLRWQPYMKAAAVADQGPKEGDTKPAADGGTLVLKDGHWVKQGGDAAAAWDAMTTDQKAAILATTSPLYTTGYTGKPNAKAKKLAAAGWDALTDAVKAKAAHLVSMYAKHKAAKKPAPVMPEKPVYAEPEADKDQSALKTIGGITFEAVKSGAVWKVKVAGADNLVDGVHADSKGGLWAKLSQHHGSVGGDSFASEFGGKTSSAVNATQLAKLQAIPWFKLKLPAENTNAKSHNAAVAKIEAMAFAGDTAGLQAFIDAKAGAKQTYAKKQVLTAQTALAALQQPGATAAVPVEPEPAVPQGPTANTPVPAATDKVTSLTRKQVQGLHGWLKAGQPTSKHPDSWSNLWKKLSSNMKAAVKAEMEPDAPPEAKPAVTADTPLTQGQKDAVDAMSIDDLQALAGDDQPLPANVKAAIKKKLATASIAPAKAQPDQPSLAEQLVAASSAEQKQGVANRFLAAHGESAQNFEKLADAFWKDGDYATSHYWANKAKDADAPKEGDTKQGADGMLVLKDGHWVKAGGNPSLIDGWKASIAAGKTPTKAQADAMAALEDSDPDEYMAVFMEAVNDSIPAELQNDDSFDDALEAHNQKAYSLQAAALASSPSAAAALTPAIDTAAPSMDDWEQIGQQKGSNPGGVFQDPTGQEWYCKWPSDPAAIKSEVLAAKLYALAGLSSQDCMVVTKNGKPAIATKWVDIKKASSATALAKVPGVLEGFAVDAWLGNWDVVGMGLDNLQIGPDGKAHRVDAGGSLEYRAQGEKKPFGNKVEEIDTLRDAAKNPHAAAVFGKIKQADLLASVAKVAAISDVAIRAMVNEFGPGDAAAKAKLAETLIARKKDLIAKFPKAAKPKKKPTFDATKISAPPSFLNWGGTGKSGPSSKEFLNKANDDTVQAIFAAAKTGKLDAIKSLTAPVFDKDSGQVTGHKPVLEHPSQHVKGYAQQSINEINYQLNPPKRFRFDGGHPLHALNSAYPAHAGAKSSATAQKLGKFIVLGEPGLVKLEDVGLPAKITHAEGGGTLSTSTYAPAAKAAFHKMPATQKQAIQSYTGSSYHEMNGSLWSGNPSGAAKAAGEALKTLGHDIQPGTVLSRKISLHGDDLQMLLGAKGKVLQEPAIMSTSVRPSSWSGNVHLKLHVGPGVKGLWVGKGSSPNGGAISKHGGEDEMILPPNTRLLVLSTKAGGSKDADGFGLHSSHVIECIVLPTQ